MQCPSSTRCTDVFRNNDCIRLISDLHRIPNLQLNHEVNNTSRLCHMSTRSGISYILWFCDANLLKSRCFNIFR